MSRGRIPSTTAGTVAGSNHHRRVLLLPQCLRPSASCPGKLSREGMQCPDDCTESCVLRQCREAAVAQGYVGVCVAAGGSMALRFVKQLQPERIVAVACPKELDLGVRSVEEMIGSLDTVPSVRVVPLSKDGCVDTEVDVDRVLRAIGEC